MRHGSAKKFLLTVIPADADFCSVKACLSTGHIFVISLMVASHFSNTVIPGFEYVCTQEISIIYIYDRCLTNMHKASWKICILQNFE